MFWQYWRSAWLAPHAPLVFRVCASTALLVILLALIAPRPAAPQAHAAPAALTLVVTSTADLPDFLPGDGACETAPNNGVCTLRAAVQEASVLVGDNTIILQAGTTYSLTIPAFNGGGDLNAVGPLTILGAGAGSTFIDGNGIVTDDRVFALTGTVTISGVTIMHGRNDVYGGGILNLGALTLINSAVISNSMFGSGGFGGGIASVRGLTLSHSIVASNTVNGAVVGGGGLYLDRGRLWIEDSVIQGNQVNGGGGGIYTFSNDGTIINSAISGNHGTSGGGIQNFGDRLDIVNSTVALNLSDGDGGGIANHDANLNLYNVTVAGNLANADSSGGGQGAGVTNSGTGTLSLRNSIIANNYRVATPGPFALADDCSGTVTSVVISLVGFIDGGHCIVIGPHFETSIVLGPFQDNGGPTWTYALPRNSLAINTGDFFGCKDNHGAILLVDQRHRGRPDRCDLGAFEFPLLLDLPLIRR